MEDNKSILEDSNYILSSVKKEEIDKDSFSVLLSNLSDINEEFKEYHEAFKQNDNNKDNKVFKINNFEGPKSVIDFFKDPKNKSKAKDLNKMGFNPATIMITISLAEIEKDVNEIKEISKDILSFLDNDKQAEIEGDLKTLNRVIVDYKYNWEDEQYIDNNYNQMLDIKRTAMKNINFYQKQIADDIKKSGFLKTNKSINENQDELEQDFSYYRLSLYVYSFASFMEIMLLENFQKEYLSSRKEELITLSNEYVDNYNKAYEFVKNEANKSLQGNVLSGIGNTGKALGGLSEKVSFLKDKKIDSWFNKGGEDLKNKSQDMKDNISSKFEEMKDSNINIFTDKIDSISKIYNDTKDIYFDKERIYLQMVK